MRAKLGFSREEEVDDQLIGDLLTLMARARADYTLSFRNLSGQDADWLGLFGEAEADANAWLSRYRSRVEGEDLRALDHINPKFVLRNWIAETVIRALEDQGDISTLDRIFQILRTPFQEHDGDEAFAASPPPNLCDLEVSCSS